MTRNEAYNSMIMSIFYMHLSLLPFLSLSLSHTYKFFYAKRTIYNIKAIDTQLLQSNTKVQRHTMRIVTIIMKILYLYGKKKKKKNTILRLT